MRAKTRLSDGVSVLRWLGDEEVIPTEHNSEGEESHN